MDEEIARLEQRLTVGWQKCDDARPGPDRDWLEDFWIDLLHQYEDRCDQRDGTADRRDFSPGR